MTNGGTPANAAPAPKRRKREHEGKGVISATLIAIASFAALWLLQEYKDYVAQFPEAATKAVTTTLGASMVGSATVLLRSVWKMLPIRSELTPPREDAVQERDEAEEQLRVQTREGSPPLEAAQYRRLAVEWKQRHDAIRDEANRRIQHANQKIQQSVRDANEANESNAALRYALTCGLVMAVASGISTYLVPPQPASQLNEHIVGLIVAYSIIAFSYGFRAGQSLLPPNRSIAFRVGGLGSLYANAVSVIINLAYAWDALFGENAPRVGTVPLGFFIVFARLLLLPAVSVLACWFGCLVATPFHGRVHS